MTDGLISEKLITEYVRLTKVVDKRKFHIYPFYCYSRYIQRMKNGLMNQTRGPMYGIVNFADVHIISAELYCALVARSINLIFLRLLALMSIVR